MYKHTIHTYILYCTQHTQHLYIHMYIYPKCTHVYTEIDTQTYRNTCKKTALLLLKKHTFCYNSNRTLLIQFTACMIYFSLLIINISNNSEQFFHWMFVSRKYIMYMYRNTCLQACIYSVTHHICT